MGWLASRLDWRVEPLLATRDGDARRHGPRRAATRSRSSSSPPELQVRGLAGVTLETAAGPRSRSTAGPAACAPTTRNARGEERTWTMLGASRGEAGILGEGIRQALLRDPTYAPALAAACAVVA